MGIDIFSVNKYFLSFYIFFFKEGKLVSLKASNHITLNFILSCYLPNQLQFIEKVPCFLPFIYPITINTFTSQYKNYPTINLDPHFPRLPSSISVLHFRVRHSFRNVCVSQCFFFAELSSRTTSTQAYVS